jgi:hypothetical protein
MKPSPPRTAPIHCADRRRRAFVVRCPPSTPMARRLPRTAAEDIAIGPERGGLSADLGETLRRSRISPVTAGHRADAGRAEPGRVTGARTELVSRPGHSPGQDRCHGATDPPAPRRVVRVNLWCSEVTRLALVAQCHSAYDDHCQSSPCGTQGSWHKCQERRCQRSPQLCVTIRDASVSLTKVKAIGAPFERVHAAR